MTDFNVNPPARPRGPRRWLVAAVAAAVVVTAVVVLAVVAPGLTKVRGVPTAETGAGPSSTASSTTPTTTPTPRGPVRGLQQAMRQLASAAADKDMAALRKLRCAETTQRVDKAMRMVGELRDLLVSESMFTNYPRWRVVPMYATPPGEPDIDLHAILRKVGNAWCVYDVTGGYTVAGSKVGFPTMPRGFPYDPFPVAQDFLAKVNTGDATAAADWACDEERIADLRSDVDELLVVENLRVDLSTRPDDFGEVPVVGTRNGQPVEGTVLVMKDPGYSGLSCVLLASVY